MSGPEQSWITTNKVNRRLCWVVLFEGLIIVGLVFGIISLFPLKTKEFVFVEFTSGGQNFVQMMREGSPLYTNDTLLSATIRDYVASRETVDNITNDQRFTKVLHMSSNDVFERFKRTNKNIVLQGKKGFKRTIEILRDSPIGKGIHEVAFKTHDTSPMGSKKETKWKAILKFHVLSKKPVKYEDRLKNPTNIEIVDYVISKEK